MNPVGSQISKCVVLQQCFQEESFKHKQNLVSELWKMMFAYYLMSMGSPLTFHEKTL